MSLWLDGAARGSAAFDLDWTGNGEYLPFEALVAIHMVHRLFAIVAKGDEVLNWREMLAFCQGGEVHLLPEGDHAISDFGDQMDALFHFLRLAP